MISVSIILVISSFLNTQIACNDVDEFDKFKSEILVKIHQLKNENDKLKSRNALLEARVRENKSKLTLFELKIGELESEMEEMRRGVNECYTYPCENQATCVDLINGYECKCMPGTTG